MEQPIVVQGKASTRCRLCNRILKSAKSIAVGIGCTCRKHLGMDGTTRRDRAHRIRKRRLRIQMEQEMYESQQMAFDFMTRKESA